MPNSRAVVVLGMHRSGTSAFARGLKAMGVYLGNDFLETKPDNPTGYWEDRTIVALNERILSALGLQWEDVTLIEDDFCEKPEVATIRGLAIDHLRQNFETHPLWGFKDPRTIRLLPFWRSVLETVGVEDNYLVAIRNPLSVASSLQQRQYMDAPTAHKLWLAYSVPNLHLIRARPFVVADYDFLMDDPRAELARISSALKLPAENSNEIAYFVNEFLAADLRHSEFSEFDFETILGISTLTREAYLWLRRLAATDTDAENPQFWSAWERITIAVRSLIGGKTA